MRRAIFVSLAFTLACTPAGSGDDEVFTSFDGTTTTEGDQPTSGFPVDTESSSASTSDSESTSTSETSSTDTSDSDSSDTTTGGDGDGDVGPRPVIYQLVVRHFGNTNQTRATNASLSENGVGKFDDIDDTAIAGLVELGVTHVWLTGVLRQATLTNYNGYGMPADDPDTVKGRAGSFYAVRDYYDVSPDYAMDPTMRMTEFDALVERLHAANLRVMIDIVPNHVARGYGSVVMPDTDFGASDDQSVFFAPDNNFFYLPAGQALQLSKPGNYNPQGFTFDGAFAREDGTLGKLTKVTGNNVVSNTPGATDWYETIKLNWGWDFVNQTGDYDPIPDTWLKMDAIIAYWQDHGVDGFRCDFAHFVPNEAWTYLIEEAKLRDGEVYFVAEAYADLDGLLAAGFDAVYHDAAYDTLKRIYQGNATQQQYSDTMNLLGNGQRDLYLHYLENHDERRIASPIVGGPNPDDSGFGGMNAGYQLAPLAFLYNAGPILVYNGQEVGETGAGVEGFGQDDGRTSIFDYWSLAELSKWVNGGAYDGGLLSPEQVALRSFYADLLALTQDPAALGGGYWGLEYVNNPGAHADCPDGLYTFARYEPASGRALVVVANFAPGMTSSGQVRLAQDLVDAIGLPSDVTVTKVLDEAGAAAELVASTTAAALVSDGFGVDVPDQRAHVFVIE